MRMPSHLGVSIALLLTCGLFAACGGGDELGPSSLEDSDGAPPSSSSSSGGGGPGVEDASPDVDGSSPSPTPFEPDPFADHVSGARLRARVWVAGERRIFEQFEDTQYGVCTPALAEDGELRCLPDWPGFGAYFLDEECTVQVMMGTCVAPSAHVSVDVEGGGRRVHEAVSLGGTIETVYRRSSSMCLPQRANGQLYRVGAAVPAERFVAMSEQIEGDQRLRERKLRGEDGSSLSVGIYDAQEEIDCRIREDEATTSRCLPLASTNRYTDAACSQPLFVGREAPPKYVLPAAGPARVFAVGASVSAPNQYLQSASNCLSTISPLNTTSYATSPVAASLFEAASAAHMGEGRLKRPRAASEDGFVPMPPIGYEPPVAFDSELQANCHPSADRDGNLRCMPYAVTYQLLNQFSDAACTKRVVIGNTQYPEGTFVREERRSPETCAERRYDLLRIGATEAYERFYAIGAEGQCTDAPGVPASLASTLEEIPSDTLVLLTRERE